MDIKEIKKNILNEIKKRKHSLNIHIDDMTPSGRERSAPMYEINIKNEFLGLQKIVKSKFQHDLKARAEIQILKWEDQELKVRLQKAINNKAEQVEINNQLIKEKREEIEKILISTLKIDDKIDWEKMKDKSEYPIIFSHKKKEFSDLEIYRPRKPIPTFFEKIFPFLFSKKLKQFNKDFEAWENQNKLMKTARQMEDQKYEKEKQKYEKEKQKYDTHKMIFYKNQEKQNKKIDDFRYRFEIGEENAILEYISSVFERSEYPSSFYIEYESEYEKESKTIVVNVHCPSQEKISKIKELRYQKSTDTIKEILFKEKEYDAIYDSALKQCALRTLHEIFESIYTDFIQIAVVNIWVTYIDPATGTDKTSCIMSISANRSEFEKIRLDRIDLDSCIKGLKGLIAGPLSNMAPVKPIMQLNRKSNKFVESRDQLADLNSTTNLAEMDWEDFEHLVRELFSKIFSSEDSEVKVTQSSRDGGIDAVVFDPDPIRGGKFVIQAKRYTNTVGVSAVRDLYGTMISEGAVKGILVTTASFGRDSRDFIKDKPITLINGSNLVYLLEEHGHKVRIDVKAAKLKKSVTV